MNETFQGPLKGFKDAYLYRRLRHTKHAHTLKASNLQNAQGNECPLLLINHRVGKPEGLLHPRRTRLRVARSTNPFKDTLCLSWPV